MNHIYYYYEFELFSFSSYNMNYIYYYYEFELFSFISYNMNYIYSFYEFELFSFISYNYLKQKYYSVSLISCIEMCIACCMCNYLDCGEALNNQHNGIIQSLGFPNWNQGNQHCTWTITADSSNIIRITFKEVGLHSTNTFCEEANITVFNATASLVDRYCVH